MVEDPIGWTVFRVPRSHWHCTWENFNWESVTPTSLQEELRSWRQKVLEGKPSHLILYGLPGTGKTHQGVALYRQLASLLGTELATFVNVPRFCETVKDSYRNQGNGPDPWAGIEAAKAAVVLDDLFGRELTQHDASQIVNRLIDTTYRNGAALLANMNQDIEELKARLPAHEISRLLADARVIHVRADRDWRREASE